MCKRGDMSTCVFFLLLLARKINPVKLVHDRVCSMDLSFSSGMLGIFAIGRSTIINQPSTIFREGNFQAALFWPYLLFLLQLKHNKTVLK